MCGGIVDFMAQLLCLVACDLTYANCVLHGVQTVVVSGVRPDEEGSHQDDVEMDSAPQRGAVPVSGAVVAHGTVSLPATANPMGAGGSAPILVVGMTESGGASINVGPASLRRQMQGDGGLRSKPPRWPRLPLNKKHKKVNFYFPRLNFLIMCKVL